MLEVAGNERRIKDIAVHEQRVSGEKTSQPTHLVLCQTPPSYACSLHAVASVTFASKPRTEASLGTAGTVAEQKYTLAQEIRLVKRAGFMLHKAGQQDYCRVETTRRGAIYVSSPALRPDVRLLQRQRVRNPGAPIL
jgi:hypothetical protein